MATLVIDTDQTFASVILLASERKVKFGTTTGEVDTTTAGVPKWVGQFAATYRTAPGERVQTELINVVIASDADPFAGLIAPAPCRIEGLRAGLSKPEASDRGIRGGKWFWSATAVQALVPAGSRNGRGEG